MRLRTIVLATLLSTLLSLCVWTSAGATTIPINTGNIGKALNRGDADPSVTWNYTGSHADPRFVSYVDNDPAFPGPTTLGSVHVAGGNARLGNNALYGSDVPGSYPAYRGVQFFYLTFDLPTEAINVSLTVTDIGADDRVGLHLNSFEIGFWGNHSGSDAPGRIDGSDVYGGTSIGVGVEPTRSSGVTLHSPFGYPDFTLTDTSLFNVGSTNVVRLWVNNTGTRSATAAARPMRSGDPTVVGFDATLTYDLATPVPEPGSMLLLGSGLVGLAGYGRKRWKK